MSTIKKFAFFAGHGGSDNGAIGVGGVHEDDKTLLITKECVRLMNAVGHKTITNRTTDVESTIDSKVNYANAQNVDALFEIHLNAFNGQGLGTETYYDHDGGISKTLALHIDAQLVQEGYRDRGIKIRLGQDGNDYFGVIRQSKAPAVLIECCFIDSANDMKIFNPTKAAQAIVDAILEVFPAPPKPVVVKPTPVKPTVYKMRTGAKIQIVGKDATYGGSSKGVRVPSSKKNVTYTVQQIGTSSVNPGQVLVKELFSWVYTKDIKIVG